MALRFSIGCIDKKPTFRFLLENPVLHLYLVIRIEADQFHSREVQRRKIFFELLTFVIPEHNPVFLEEICQVLLQCRIHFAFSPLLRLNSSCA